MNTRPKNILFDLDGTLVDSRVSIRNSLHFALEEMGHAATQGPPIDSLIGAPLLDIFRDAYGLPAARIAEAIDHYRRHYAEQGMQGTEVYPGIARLLERLHKGGFGLYIATVKPQPVASSVLEGAELVQFFSGISGSSMDSSRRHKADIIEHALQTNDLVAAESWMVGDRHHDIEGGRAHGLATLGVAWGFGSREELAAAGADGIVSTADEIWAATGMHKEGI